MKIINNNNKNAFTLSEILVTLGIVGVIATLTLPNLMSSYTKKQQVAQLQRTVNALTSAAQNYLLDNQADTIRDTNLKDDTTRFLKEYLRATHLGGVLEEAMPGNYRSVSSDIVDNVRLTLDSCIGGHANGKNAYDCGKLTIGSIVCINTHYPNGGDQSIIVDINGKGKPNVFGRDLFVMSLNNKGKIVRWNGGWSDTNISGNYKYEYGYEYNSGGITLKNCLDNASYCYGQIVRDGWEMNY